MDGLPTLEGRHDKARLSTNDLSARMNISLAENLAEALFRGDALLSGSFHVNIGLKWNGKIREGFNVIRVATLAIGRPRLKFPSTNNYKIGVW